jgi:predicted XRE-type DNA-binding protein
MSGHKNFRELRAQLRASPEYDRLLERRRMVQEMELVDAVQALTALREARGVTQAEIAEAWETTQSNVSRFEHAQETYLSTLIRYAAALGGRLELRVVFPDQVVDLTPGETKPVVAKRK